MPDEFPFHKNLKMSECYLAYWELLPTIDHIIPVSRRGSDEESNWACTSQLRNSAKSNCLFEELGWHIHEPGNLKDWDDLVKWFMDCVMGNPKILKDKYINSWYKSAREAIKP